MHPHKPERIFTNDGQELCWCTQQRAWCHDGRIANAAMQEDAANVALVRLVIGCLGFLGWGIVVWYLLSWHQPQLGTTRAQRLFQTAVTQEDVPQSREVQTGTRKTMPAPGQRWRYISPKEPGDPFPTIEADNDSLVTIREVKDGWVRYDYSHIKDLRRELTYFVKMWHYVDDGAPPATPGRR